MTLEASLAIDLDRLLRLRLVVARFGEMDLACWWNSKGMLGRHGAVVLRRGIPSTHYFTQARVVFEVAHSRCHEFFDPPGCITLWNLPVDIMGQLDQLDEWGSPTRPRSPLRPNVGGCRIFSTIEM